MAGSATVTGKQYYVQAIGHPIAEPSTETPPLVLESSFEGAGVVVMSSSAPNNSDGRPNGTIYIQTA